MTIPEREREHAPQVLHATVAEALVGGEDDFGIAPRGEGPAGRLQARAQVAKVVDLAIEDDVAATVGARHRLLAGDEVDDGQAGHTETDTLLDVLAVRVGATVAETLEHPRQQRCRRIADVSGDTTHS